jgi:5-formyltetrahydrofolate cyclo-ligase
MGEDQDNRKRALRAEMTAVRRGLGGSVAASSSAQVCERVLRLPVFATAQHLVTYAAVGNEVDPAALVAAALETGKCVYLPCRELGDFRVIAPKDSRQGSGTRGQRTPDDSLSRTTNDVLFIVPGLAFDPRGVRLGRGGGWYDRALSRYRDGIRVGLAYDFQVVPHLPEAAWDIRMHAVVTERRLLGELADRIGQ